MIVNVYCPSKDKHFSLDIGLDLLLQDFKALCSVECGVSVPQMKVFLNSQELLDNEKSLGSYDVRDNDMFLLQTAVLPQNLPSQATGSVPRIDFSNVKVPSRPSSASSSQQAHSSQRPNMDDPATLRSWFLNSPHNLALLKERNPQLAEALISGDIQRFSTELGKIRDANMKAEKERMELMNANPFDLEVQKKIAEAIEKKNIEENMNMAIEEAPESFGQVVMLWINLRVNGHHVKAFVDSGAQMTIMSTACADRCNIMRLVDRRWEGIAKGVGTQKIVGRIHLAQIQIEDVFLQCSFSILEDQPMDVLLGLDMLRRHLCVIDLRENSLIIGTTITKTTFLSENELPSHGRLHDPTSNNESMNNDESSINKAILESKNDDAENEEAEINKALLESAAEASKHDQGNEAPTSSAPAAKVPKSTTSGQASVNRDKVEQLVAMGFPRSAAEDELRMTNGDVERAAVSLAMKNMSR
ncbi:protein DDI1 homolog 2-like [Clavelina lepadiformis]|uniref:protein DDI1 homolog 2-like n=1 Tax=Clavelina lepadiformis TaxID=159417 RepID=UPI0040422368